MSSPRSTAEPARFPAIRWRGALQFVTGVAIELALWFALACLQLWGNPASIRDTIPRGSEASATVPLLNVWTVGWNGAQAASGFRGYFHAPIFYPEPGAFTYSEMQPTTLVVAPLVWSLGPVVAYNVCLAFQLALTATLARRIVTSLDQRRWLAILAGVLFLHLPFVWAELGVLQLTAAWGPLAVIHATRALARRPAVTPAVMLGFAAAACYAACNYYGLFLILLTPPFVILLWPNRTVETPGQRFAPFAYLAFAYLALAYLALAVVVAAAAVSPLLAGQLKYLNAAVSPRPTAWVRYFSARPSDYLPSLPILTLGSDRDLSGQGSAVGALAVAPQPVPRDLGPGIVVTTLAVLGVVGVLLSRPRQSIRPRQTDADSDPVSALDRALSRDPERTRVDDRERSRWVGFCTTLALAAIVASFGPRVSMFGFVPWEWVGDRFSPLRLIRTPFRFALFYQIAMTFLAIEGIGRVHDWLGQPNRRWRPRWTAAGCLFASALAVIGTWPARSPLEDVRDLIAPPAWSLWLRDHTPPGSAVAGLPMPRRGKTTDYEPTTRLMVRSLEFKRPLVNGYSGFFPPRYRQLRAASHDFPSPDTIQELWLLGVRYLVIDRARFDAWGDGPASWPRSPGISVSVAYADPVEPVVVCRLKGSAN